MGLRAWRDRLDVTTLALVATVVVIVASLVPIPERGAQAVGGVAFAHVDKVVHAVSYAVISGLAAASREWRRRRSLVLLVVAIALLGASVEVAQTFVPGRTATVGDTVANTLGAAVGVLAGVSLRRWYHRENRRSARR